MNSEKGTCLNATHMETFGPHKQIWSDEKGTYTEAGNYLSDRLVSSCSGWTRTPPTSQASPPERPERLGLICGNCDGNGYEPDSIRADEMLCEDCHGTGREPAQPTDETPTSEGEMK